jgi:outer membrane lipoprotein-sorting protein
MYDRELRAPTTLLVSQTPLGILLRREVRLSGDVTVTGIERTGPFLRVSMYRTSEPGEGMLTLVFNNDPLELRQWAVIDAQRRETRVTLSRIETGQRFPAGLFQFNDPRFFEPGGFGTPQSRGT